MYVKRDIEKILLKASESFQVITLFGSRQVGKTTTADYLFGDEFGFVTLDDSDELALAHMNPKAFFESHPWPLIIDEVQKEPGLLSEIKRIVDEQRRIWMRNGEKRRLMYVLTGSNQFKLQEGISESLAGRTAVFSMSGFSQMEKRGIPGSQFEVDFDTLINKQRKYPEFYLERDVRKLISASSEMQFRQFIEFLALRTAQELVYSDITKDLGINVETCKRWISILQTSGIVYLLQPYMANMSKRIIKTPKLYFMDTGLCAHLCKWPTYQMLKDGVMSGAFFETYVVSEVIKSFLNNGEDPAQYLYYYRDIDKKEVDLIKSMI